MVFYSKKYKDNPSGFPDRDRNPKSKDDKYHLQWAEAIYSKFLGDKTAWPFEQRSWWNYLRAYSKGEQSVTKYQSWLLGDNTTDEGAYTSYDDAIGSLSKRAKREGWYNVLWDIVSPAPKIMNSIHGMFDDLEYDVFADVVDAKSKDLEEDKKWKTIVEGKFASWQAEFKKNAGIPMDEEVPLPKSEEEFDRMASKEGYKLGVAKAMQKLTRYAVEGDSKWMDVIKKKVLEDFIAIGRAAIKDYFDPEDGKFKVKYLDVANVIIQHSKEFDFNDSEYAGYFGVWTISNLKTKRPDIPEKQWKELAKQYTGYLGNPSDSGNFDSLYGTAGSDNLSYKYDEFKVSVLETEWIDTDSKKALKYHSVYGRDTYHRVGYDKDLDPLSKKQVKKGASQSLVKTNVRLLRQCSWVVGSEVIFDAGPVNMAARPDKTKPKLSIRVESLQSKSLTEQLYPIYDQFFMAWLRHQNSMSMMIEKGYAVDMSMLMNITDGEGKKWDWDQVMNMWKQTGILPFMVSMGGGYQGGQTTPISEIPGGLGERLVESINLFAWCFKMIEDITGINPISLGATPDASAPVTTTRFALQATSNALKPIMLAILELKRAASDSLMRRLQIGLRNSKEIRETYTGVVGSADIEALVVGEKSAAQYGIVLKERPGELYKERIKAYIEAALQSGRDGRPGLTAPQALYFEERLSQGADLIEIRQQISYEIEKDKQEMEMSKQNAIEQQSQAVQQQEQQKSQNIAGLKQMESQLRMQEDSHATGNKAALNKQTNNYDYLKGLQELAVKEEESKNKVNNANS